MDELTSTESSLVMVHCARSSLQKVGGCSGCCAPYHTGVHVVNVGASSLVESSRRWRDSPVPDCTCDMVPWCDCGVNECD